ENSDRLAGLNEQRLVAFELAKRRNDAIKTLPIARRAAYSAIHDKLARPLRDVWIEIVHQHAERRLRQPALGADVGAAGGSDRTVVVQSSIHRRTLQASIVSQVSETGSARTPTSQLQTACRLRPAPLPSQGRRPSSDRNRAPAPARAKPQ